MLLFYCSVLETKYGQSRVFSILRKKTEKGKCKLSKKKVQCPSGRSLSVFQRRLKP